MTHPHPRQQEKHVSDNGHPKCHGCYRSHWDGSWWCDNCDGWPCLCVEDADGELVIEELA